MEGGTAYRGQRPRLMEFVGFAKLELLPGGCLNFQNSDSPRRILRGDIPGAV